MQNNRIRIIGLDPGLRRLGWGVLDVEGARLNWVAHGVILPDEKAELSVRLLYLFEELSKVILLYRPQEAAIEETFVNMNPASTLKLGHARAAAMLAPAQAGLSVAEYAALDVKKSVVGAGRADKDQILFMIKRLLPRAAAAENGLTPDMADALAVAVTHAHKRKHRLLERVPKSVERFSKTGAQPGKKGAAA
ncbi:crossover junction endodeoxyribonuclease RuvC [Asticcacaulis excentricus]|uniref:Crossover junction endodeoxyribonuclease RuvC n=1 Tax=Asticcacaulis excentricus (strain ATCC 15261 / DSM 4724 / KCTC 12464 / NCIMB 9791 / VKM B-1370 / CB 48) TaxID=573065 RepID=E8RR34_ASTEC|nr:crossover junction endodeoxyribonuclease RuvC [Asticcacaulis excentricus]ADU13352.1 crossover junction endodeoxyribonuclease RuvC [Asticcacaulis excentricus CB 48]